MTNAWQKCRQLSSWSGGYIEWTEDQTAYLSVVFSWQLQQAYQRAVWWRQLGYEVIAGGPAVTYNPDYLVNVARTNSSLPALKRHNPKACFTTRGCIRRCQFCLVPKIEGKFRELRNINLAPVVCDNNFLASSKRHFDWVIDNLKMFKDVDFNQGLDARLLTKYHAGRLAELDLRCIRLAWDHINEEDSFRHAYQLLRDADIPKQKIRAYVLIGFRDTPEDALYRLSEVRKLGAWTNPMRYQTLDAVRRNEYVGKYWTHRELQRYMRYWSNLRHLSGVPFEEFER